MNSETAQLLDRASRGDALAMDTLLEQHLPGLRAFVRQRVGALVQARESPTDVVQSACREVLEHVDRFQYDGEEGFRRWLYTTALRKIKDRHRFWLARKREVDREIQMKQGSADSSRVGELFEVLHSPSQQAIAHEEFHRLQSAFMQLPENYRTVVLLAQVDGLTHAQIATRLDVTESYARVLLSRALARLARLMRRPSEDEAG